MAAVSSSRQRGGEGGSWEHRRNRSEDNRQNFSLPYQTQSPPQSPSIQDEFVGSDNKPLPGRDVQSEFDNRSYQYDNHTNALPDHSSYPREYQQRSIGRAAPSGAEHSGGIAVPRMRQPSHPEGRQERSYNAASASRFARKGNVDRSRDDDSNWVHRDKLIALEIQDHIDRGERVPKALLEAQAQAANGGSYYSNRHDAQHELTENNLHRLTTNTPPAEDHIDNDGRYIPEDPRTPEEVFGGTKEMGNTGVTHQSPGARPGTSRIPVSKTGTRSRSQSVGSQVLLDEVETTSTPPSPSQPRRANKSHARKASGAERSIKSRAASGGAGSASRPTTGDGPPREINRPTEPAPWLNDMYKPDPLLPPDQQLLPTHAKRLHQEQLAREEAEKQREQEQIERERQREQERQRERIEREQERETRRRAAAEHAAAQRAAEERAQQEQADAVEREAHAEREHERRVDEKLPLELSDPLAPFPERFDSMKTPPPATPTQASEHGGYRTMPKVQGNQTNPQQSLRAQQSIHVQDPEAAAQKKGCGCCVVM